MATPYERVKAAWDAPDRPAALNRVVEAMAVEGMTRAELEDALTTLLLEVRAAGADDETDEVINEVGDRLYGWCHRSGWIITRDRAPVIAEWEARQAADRNGHPAADPAPARSPE